MKAQIAAILLAFSEIESGNNDNAKGKAGERSRYQITPETWRHYTSLTFDKARSYTVATDVARIILEDRLERFIRLNQRNPTPHEIYRLWNRGAGKTACDRFAAIYELKLRERNTSPTFDLK